MRKRMILILGIVFAQVHFASVFALAPQNQRLSTGAESSHQMKQLKQQKKVTPAVQNQCIYVESASMYRHCQRRRYESQFETTPSVTENSFKEGPSPHIKDIEKLSPYLFAAEYVVKHNMIDLFRSKYFFPEKELTRDEFVFMIVSAMKSEVGSVHTDCFGDIRLSKHKKQVCYAKKKNWLDNNMKFNPTGSINRAAAAKIIMTAVGGVNGFDNINDAYYDDVSANTWFARFVNAGRKRKVFPHSRNFEPGLPLLRKDAALWIYNLSNTRNLGTPGDIDIVDVKRYVESEFTSLINESRMNFGKTQLKFDQKLYDIALTNSQRMAKDSSLSHGNLDLYMTALNGEYKALGENIATMRVTGSGEVSKLVSKIHSDMMKEPSSQQNHRANILGESYTFDYYAVAAYEDKINGRYWITELFGDKR